MQCQEAGDLRAEDSEVEAVVKQACDLIVIVLTGGECLQVRNNIHNINIGDIQYSIIVSQSIDSGHQVNVHRY